MQPCICYAFRYHVPMDITAAQCRAARALIKMQQAELAEKSRVSMRTIAGFETDKTAPVPSTLSAIQRALEAAGVRFIGDTGVELAQQKESAA